MQQNQSTGMLNLRIGVAMDSPREPLADLAHMRRLMLRPRGHKERGPMTDWQWSQIQSWERNFYSIALAKAARQQGAPDNLSMAKQASKYGEKLETIRNTK
jgi:hypothetical protein